MHVSPLRRVAIPASFGLDTGGSPEMTGGRLFGTLSPGTDRIQRPITPFND